MKYFLILLLIASCNQKEEISDINCQYKNAIVYNEYPSYLRGRKMYDIKYNGKILKWIQVSDIDSSYKVGDTIDGPCRGLFTHIDK